LFVNSCRRLCDEEDELSEVEPDAVPTEVRDWLALTFTRSMSNIKRRGDDKPKFRSVANAIRAGIMVDRYVHVLDFNGSFVYSLTIFNTSFKDARSVSVYPYNRSQILQYVKYT